MHKLALFALPLAALPFASLPTAPSVEVVDVDRDGQVEEGSLETLIEILEEGGTLRVGWELPVRAPDAPDAEEAERLVHWVDAGFVTIWKEQVFAQIDDIYQQGFAMDGPALFLTPEPHGWTAILSTTGEMKQAFGDETSTQRVRTRWVASS